jgi:hypothetical protein
LKHHQQCNKYNTFTDHRCKVEFALKTFECNFKNFVKNLLAKVK